MSTAQTTAVPEPVVEPRLDAVLASGSDPRHRAPCRPA